VVALMFSDLDALLMHLATRRKWVFLETLDPGDERGRWACSAGTDPLEPGKLFGDRVVGTGADPFAAANNLLERLGPP